MSATLFNTSHKKHTGKVMPHHRTSYPALALVLLLGGLFMASLSVSAYADTLSGAGAVAVTGTVNGPPPSVAPTISTPLQNFRSTEEIIKVAGLCTADLFVQIKRNNVNAGSVQCTSTGTYQLQIQLYPGNNDLVAQQFDTLGQSSPISGSLRVGYEAPVAVTPVVTATPISNTKPGTPPAAKLVALPTPVTITSSYLYQGAYTDNRFTLPASVAGGKPPYAVNINWGDGSQNVVNVPQVGPLKTGHMYSKDGVFSVIIEIADSTGASAYLQTAIIVTGAGGVAGSVQNDGLDISTLQGRLLLAWPVYVLMGSLVLGFWLGEEYNMQRFKRPVTQA